MTGAEKVQSISLSSSSDHFKRQPPLGQVISWICKQARGGKSRPAKHDDGQSEEALICIDGFGWSDRQPMQPSIVSAGRDHSNSILSFVNRTTQRQGRPIDCHRDRIELPTGAPLITWTGLVGGTQTCTV